MVYNYLTTFIGGLKMKKLICLLLALCMVFALAACGKTDKAEEDAPAAQSGETNTDSSAKAEDAAKTDTDTVAVGAVVIARDDVAEDEIYAFVSNIFENIDAITEQHGKGAELNLEFASAVTSVPYHPGAARYFAEKGIEVAVKEGAGQGEVKDLTFGTGGESGTYYGFGGVLSNFVSGKNDFNITAVTSGGSKANIEDMMGGDVQLGFVHSDVMSYAYNGERLFDAAVDGFSVVAALYMEQVQIVTTNSAISSVADLKGKTVSIGAVGSGVYFNAIDVLNAYGMTEEDIKPVYQSFGDSADSLKDGKIDAAFIVSGAPTTAITDLATSGNVYLVGFDQEHISSLLESSPFYSAYTIPAGTY